MSEKEVTEKKENISEESMETEEIKKIPTKKKAAKKTTKKTTENKKDDTFNRTQKEVERLKKKYKLDISTFSEHSSSKVEFIDSGIPEVNEIIAGDAETGGYPRGRMVEISGPEGSGKTFLLTKVYTKCQEKGLKCFHIDAEGSYHMEFAKVHGLDPERLVFSDEDNCEKVMTWLEDVLRDNVFDVIGIDSLAALVPSRTSDSDMGKQQFGPLANAIATCYPRVNSALKKSKTCLIFINQLRDNVAAAGKPWLDPEKTPGGRVIKYYASVRITVQPKKMPKADRPDMFVGNRRIGHVLNMKTIKNKVGEPFMEGRADLMFRAPSKAIAIIEEAIEKDVIERARKKDGELYGKALKYKDMTFVPEVKYDPYTTYAWLKENGLLVSLLVEMGHEDIEKFIESEDITEEDVQEYLIENSEE